MAKMYIEDMTIAGNITKADLDEIAEATNGKVFASTSVWNGPLAYTIKWYQNVRVPTKAKQLLNGLGLPEGSFYFAFGRGGHGVGVAPYVKVRVR